MRLIELIFFNKKFSGIFFNENKIYLRLILKNKHIFSFPKKKIKIIKDEVLELEKENKKLKKKKIVFDSTKKKIILINTGGTISTSRINTKEGGLNISNFSFKEVSERLIKEKINFIEYNPYEIISEDLNLSNLKKLISLIKQIVISKEKIEGIIIFHGTDTLNYSSSLISLIFDWKINFPICFVGSQKPLDDPSTDSFGNLMGAINFILKKNYPLVFLIFKLEIFSEKRAIYRGLDLIKKHTSRTDTFKNLNSKRIGIIENFEKIKMESFPKRIEKKYFFENFEEKMGIFNFYPHSSVKEFINFLKEKKIVILLGYGLGNIPRKFLNEIGKRKKKIIFIIYSNCLEGYKNMNIYFSGRKMKELGVIDIDSKSLFSTLFRASLIYKFFENKSIEEIKKKILEIEMGDKIEKKI